MRRAGLAIACAAVAVAIVAACPRPAAAGQFSSYVYGIADNNDIYQINPQPGQQSATIAFNTGLSGSSNAVAFDRSRDQLFFLSATNDLYMWNKPLGTSPSELQLIASGATLGISSTAVYNASYYNSAFWFFKEGTNDLVKASLSYGGNTPGTVPTFGSTTSYTISGSLTATNGFGDIAINTTTGILYAATSTGLFYSVDLNNPLTASYNQIASGNPSLQLAFNEDYSLLYGQSYSTGEWYLVNMANGTLVDTGVNFQVPGTSAGFRDLAGSSINPVPEPSTLVLAGMGAAGLVWRLSRRRSCHRAAGVDG